MENIVQATPINISTEMQSSYLDYAMSVIISRALPDVRDGLKPVHRRILYAMHSSGYHHKHPYRKSARIVGEVIGKYHPHGEAAIYDALVRMAQPFSLRVTLIDGQGNFGSIDGDDPAAMRYTESRLEKITHYLMSDLGKETISFVLNYDGSEVEPEVLPAIFPNLLVNGSGGIAVGMATNIPPHNLGEVIDACCLYLANPDITLEELMEVLPGPDFPTGGIIMGKENIKAAYTNGRGLLKVRGKAVIEEDHRGRKVIVITEIPYMVNKAKMIEKAAELVNTKVIEGVSDIRDESNKSGLRVVIELKKDAAAEVILNQLYSLTSLETTFGANMLAIEGKMPKLMGLKEILHAFMEFRENVVTKRTQYLLREARAKIHLLVGLQVAISDIDAVVKLIKEASDAAEAKRQLMSKQWDIANNTLFARLNPLVETPITNPFFLSEVQTKAILEMRLQRLTNLEKDKITNDLEALSKDIEEFLSILGSRTRLLEIIQEEFQTVKSMFNSPRLTKIEAYDIQRQDEDLIERLDMVVTVTLKGYIKRVPLDAYRTQKRGGKGKSALSMTEEDAITQIFVGSTHTPMLFFSNIGKVYRLKLYKLPLGTTQGKGRPMVNLLPLAANEYITNIMPLPEDKSQWQNLEIIFATAAGNIKRNSLADFENINTNGKIAIKLSAEDSLVNVQTCAADDHVLLATNSGKATRFPVAKLRIYKSRDSDGVRGIKLSADAKVISLTILKGDDYDLVTREKYLSISLNDRIKLAAGQVPGSCQKLELDIELLQQMARNEQFILSISSNGYGKRTSVYEYPVTDRGNNGVINMNISKKTGKVVAVEALTDNHEVMLTTDKGQVIRIKTQDIRITGRNAIGVILFKTEKDERIVSAALVIEEEEENIEIGS